MAIQHEIVCGAHQIGDGLGDRPGGGGHPEPELLQQVLGIIAGAARTKEAQQSVAMGEEHRL